MKVVVTSQGTDLTNPVDLRIGRAKYFFVADVDGGTHRAVGNEQNLNAVQGAGIQAAQKVVSLEVDAVITGNVGPSAFRVLAAGGIKPSGSGSKSLLLRFLGLSSSESG